MKIKRDTRALTGWTWEEGRIVEFRERAGTYSPRIKIDIRVDGRDEWIDWIGALVPELSGLALVYRNNSNPAMCFAISARGG